MNFPPVQYLNNRQAWSSPSFIGPGPHNIAALKAPTVEAVPNTAQALPQATTDVREVYRYASFVTVRLPLSTTSIKFLDAPVSKRNFLGFRNASPGAQIIYIDFNANATTGSWLAITPGTLVVFDTVVSQDDLYAVASAAGAVLAYAYSTFPG